MDWRQPFPHVLSRSGFARLVDNDGAASVGAPRLAPTRQWNAARTSSLQLTRSFVHHHRRSIRAAPAAIASTLWIAMMTYFFVYYTTILNKVDGHFPRIGPSYSVWPYISCIGAVQLPVFQGFAIVIATLVITAFALDFWLGRDIVPGRWLRITKLGLAVVSDGFLIALSYESVDSASHLHLIFTSIQIWCMGAAKMVDDFLNQRMRKYDPTNEPLLVAKRWKRRAGFIALLSGPIAVIGIYSCQVPVGLLPDTTRCWKMVAWSAPCEWVLSCCWSAYLYMVAYDLYHAEEVRESVILRTEQHKHRALARPVDALHGGEERIPLAYQKGMVQSLQDV